jgi:putative alpha-1,2-mannosidase
MTSSPRSLQKRWTSQGCRNLSQALRQLEECFDSSVWFVRGRHEDGIWVQPFDPAKPAFYITEGVPWQYTFLCRTICRV